MNDKQPEALRLADALENGTYLLSVERERTAIELRRLYEVNAELVEACKEAEWHSLDLPPFVVEKLNAALSKAQGDNNE